MWDLKAYSEEDKQLHLLPTLALDAGSRLASRPGCFTTSESHAVTKRLAVWVVPEPLLATGRKETSLVSAGIEP
jgi:hypothetical protein